MFISSCLGGVVPEAFLVVEGTDDHMFGTRKESTWGLHLPSIPR